MDIDQPLPLLGGLTASQFMRRHWQKKPLLVRSALPMDRPPVSRARLFELAGQEGVESRLITRQGAGWSLAQGPLPRRRLPPLAQPGWTLLVQGVDLHDAAVHALLQRFRFVPDARLDDVMISYASDTGGVGPHVDSYDVFLLQVRGRRRWQISKQRDRSLVDGVPLKILRNFAPQQTYLLEPGDMLYLPPGYAHDGVADGACMTASIGFRAPAAGELARELLQRLADDAADEVGPALYRDAGQPAVAAPGAVPAELAQFARAALQSALNDPLVLARALGEYLTEPKANIWFDAPATRPLARHGPIDGVALARATRMMYDSHHVFINGEAFRARGTDARLMRVLADTRQLAAAALAKASPDARELVDGWLATGWLVTMDTEVEASHE